MTPTCPECGNQISDDFGVTTCGRCHAVLFVDMDGNVLVTEKAQEAHPAIHADFESLTADSSSFEEPPRQSAEIISSEYHQPEESENLHSLEISPTDPVETEAAVEEVETVETAEALPPFNGSEAPEGEISYTLEIENIDTKEIRAQLQEIFSEPRFQWSSQDLIKRIQKGHLRLENISSAKASVLVQKISDLPVKVSWKQNAFN